MRKRVVRNGVTVNAIAGTYVVLLGIDIADDRRAGLRGFAVRRHDRTEGETYWMKGLKTFRSVEPHPVPGQEYSSLFHPFQTFQWADYTAKPGYDYAYEVVPMYGEPNALTKGRSATVEISTEPEHGPHSVYFNRGSPATQEYARKFNNQPPDKAGPAAYRWLSRGLIEGIIGFIERATGPGFGLHGAFYEFQWPAVLDALAAASARGVDVSIVFDDIEGDTGPWDENEAAIRQAGLTQVVTPRTHGTIMHNKFVVLSHNDQPVAVLFGSTNLTENGLFGHANCAHVIEGAEPAARYLDYLSRLARDPLTTKAAGYTDENVARAPAPVALPARGEVAVFSPRSDLHALEWYADIAGRTTGALFMTFAFGMQDLFNRVFSKTDGQLRMALMEKEWNGRDKESQIARVRAVQALPNVVVAIGNHIPLNGFDQWLGELDRIVPRTNVHWVHTKFMLADPLSDHPVVITGSANFSVASTNKNDENMVVITGNTRVADIYTGEFFRLYSHYAFREAVGIFLAKNPGKTPADFGYNFLVEQGDWTADYFTVGDRHTRCARRVYFAGS